MPTAVVDRPPFDYAALAAGDREFVRGRADLIRGALKRSAEGILETGTWLAEVRERLREERCWLEWLESEFTLNYVTAYRWMAAAKQFPLVKLQSLPAPIEPAALVLLAAPNTPQRHRDEAIRLAESGQRVTHAIARGLINPPTSDPAPESADAGHHARAKLVRELESWYADARVEAWRQLAAAAGVRGPFWAHLRAALEQADLTLAVAREG